METTGRSVVSTHADTLVVLLHAYTLSPKSLTSIVNAIKDKNVLPDAEVIVPKLPLELFSFADPVSIARELVLRIDAEWQTHRNRYGRDYDQIILIGHSAGGLLARKVYLFACGQTQDAPFPGQDRESFAEPRPWVGCVRRIILLAGMNRGWSISHHMNLVNLIGYTAGQALGHLVRTISGRRLLIFHFRRGAPFITQLRLQWVAMEKERRHRKSDGPGPHDDGSATTIQLLGSVDDVVSPEDNIDLVTGASFVYLDVPFSGHRNVIQVGDTSDEGRARRAVFLQALLEDVNELHKRSRLPGDESLTPRKARDAVKHVIFVIHGIRDVGYWTNKIARRVQTVADSAAPPQVYATETSTYGYFAMFPFLLPARRREKVEWLMDQYTEARARFPKARFSFVGHSNGTYLLTRALERYPECTFDRVVFAGSVVRTDYDWQAAIKRGQVKAILNYLADADWVVAIFPGALEKLRFQDLGSAGFDGFRQANVDPIYQYSYVRGGHGAALREENWDAIARFIVNGPPAPKCKEIFDDRPNCGVRVLGRFAPLVWLCLAGLVVGGGRAIWRGPIRERERTLGLVAYIWCIWKILTRV